MLNPSLKVEGEKRVKCICIQRNSVNMTRVYYENGCKLKKMTMILFLPAIYHA